MHYKIRMALAAPMLSLCLLGASVSSNDAYASNETFKPPFNSAMKSNKNASERLTAWRVRLTEQSVSFRSRLSDHQRKTNSRKSRSVVNFNRDANSGSHVRSGLADQKKSASGKRPGKADKQTGSYTRLISKYASQHGVPYNLARSVVKIESSFRPNVTGAAGEIGLMQIKLSTARGMGYKGSRKQLYDPATNLYWGMKYLGRAHSLSGGTICGTILKYNAGHGAKRMNPVSSRYCQKVKRTLGAA